MGKNLADRREEGVRRILETSHKIAESMGFLLHRPLVDGGLYRENREFHVLALRVQHAEVWDRIVNVRLSDEEVVEFPAGLTNESTFAKIREGISELVKDLDPREAPVTIGGVRGRR